MIPGNSSSTKMKALIKNIPNLLTFFNMCAGISALFLNIKSTGEDCRVLSYSLILAAVVLDTIDGKTARMLNAESELGKQLDSFSDFVSFGIAPIALLFTLESIRNMPGALFVLMLYPVAGAFRLARYNLDDCSDYFIGLPITCAGFIQASFGLLLTRFTVVPNWAAIVAILLTVTLSVMMVATFKVNRIRLGRSKAKSGNMSPIC